MKIRDLSMRNTSTKVELRYNFWATGSAKFKFTSMKSIILFICSVIFVFELKAENNDRDLRVWQREVVPGAFCGDGTPYHYFISAGQSKKIAFTFMGGGACWSKETCYGSQTKTILFPVASPPEKGGFVSLNRIFSPAYDYTMIYFPYCTGDVHLGNHSANYQGKIVNHFGARNIERSLQHIRNKNEVKFEEASHLMVYGYSAGAIGALVNAATIEPYFSAGIQKVLIPDSPGLHFGESFWKKFTNNLVADYSTAMRKVDIELDVNDGFIAQSVDRVCSHLFNWKILFLQSTHDVVMSKVFGEISQEKHAALVTGPKGLKQKAAIENDNCEAWIPRSSSHTYLVSTPTSIIERDEQSSALQFIKQHLNLTH